jgi:hypothetical protein
MGEGIVLSFQSTIVQKRGGHFQTLGPFSIYLIYVHPVDTGYVYEDNEY